MEVRKFRSCLSVTGEIPSRVRTALLSNGMYGKEKDMATTMTMTFLPLSSFLYLPSFLPYYLGALVLLRILLLLCNVLCRWRL
jgi:hypothetical protein